MVLDQVLIRWLTILFVTLSLAGCGGNGTRSLPTSGPSGTHSVSTPHEPTTAREAEKDVARLTAELAKAKALATELREQERQEARRRWVLWLTIVSLLGTVGCAVAAWFLPVGRKTLIGAAVGLACVPILIRVLNLVETWAFWLMPLLILGGAAIYLLPQIKKRLDPEKLKKQLRF